MIELLTEQRGPRVKVWSRHKREASRLGTMYGYRAVYAGKEFGFNYFASYYQGREITALALREWRRGVRMLGHRYLQEKGLH